MYEDSHYGDRGTYLLEFVAAFFYVQLLPIMAFCIFCLIIYYSWRVIVRGLSRVFPNSFIDALPEFLLGLLICLVFPPYLIIGLVSKGYHEMGRGFLFGGTVGNLIWCIYVYTIAPKLIMGLALVFLPYGLVVGVTILYWDKLMNINWAKAKKFFERLK